ncbi:MAG: SoxS protein [Paracoccus sp. (in: a-proteobacteria)]
MTPSTPRPRILGPVIARRSLLCGLAAMPLAGMPGQGRAATFPNAPDWRAAPVWLMMVTSPACHHCAAWKAEIGPGYAASVEGRIAPIFEVDLRGPYPDGLALDRRPWITPSFLLLRHGAELGRIEGYVGKRHFHPVLNSLLVEAGLAPANGGAG